MEYTEIMEPTRESPTDLENISFEPSKLLEETITNLGRDLYDALIKADRYDEIAALNELIGDLATLASTYGGQTNRLREDLGVSLNEAALLKLHAIKHKTGSLEWKSYADDAKSMLDELGQ
jgi:hypothetical protein